MCAIRIALFNCSVPLGLFAKEELISNLKYLLTHIKWKPIRENRLLRIVQKYLDKLLRP